MPKTSNGELGDRHARHDELKCALKSEIEENPGPRCQLVLNGLNSLAMWRKLVTEHADRKDVAVEVRGDELVALWMQMSILSAIYLEKRRPLTASEVHAAAMSSKNDGLRKLRKLQALGFIVEDQASKKDERTKYFKPTEIGLHALDEQALFADELHKKLPDDLGEALRTTKLA